MLFRSLWQTAALLLVFAGVAKGEDWPEFRGPDGQGHSTETGLPVQWGPAKNVAWNTAIPGKGWSSPIVVKGRVYLTTAAAREGGQPGDLSLRAMCLGARDGKVLWDTEVFIQKQGSPAIHFKNSHASSTPLTDGERLYVHFGHQGTACLDLNGQVLWSNRDLGYTPVHGNGGSPILCGDLLIFSCDGAEERFVVALEKASGKVRWKTARPGDPYKKFSFSTPLLIDWLGRKEVISPASDMVLAYDPATGKELWKVRYEGYSVVPRPVFAHGLVFISTGFDTPTVMAIRPGGDGDVTDTHVVWKIKKGAPNTPSALVVGDELYLVADGGMATCLNARTGTEIWRERLAGAYSASPLSADGKIYFQNEDGVGTVITAGRRFRQLGRNDLGEPSLASGAIADRALFLRTEKHLYRIQEP
jgi:outer membrane protein assembly factor BamB